MLRLFIVKVSVLGYFPLNLPKSYYQIFYETNSCYTIGISELSRHVYRGSVN